MEAFKKTVYPLLRTNCSACHSTDNHSASGAQAPLHADADVNLAHEYALTRVNFRDPANSKLVVRMGIDRHNCFGWDEVIRVGFTFVGPPKPLPTPPKHSP